MFYRWELIGKANDTIVLSQVCDLTEKNGKIMFEAYMSLERNSSKKIIRTENAATFLDFENVPIYKLKYKIASVYVDFNGDKYKAAEVGVINHPEDGYKIVSFIWNK